MKRLEKKYKFVREKYNNIETKLVHYTSIPFFVISFSRLRNFCVNSYYSKNVLSKFHLSSKVLKMSLRNGFMFGWKKHSF